jgi:4a-hydroxytetrahydrobiopterin dehydratase
VSDVPKLLTAAEVSAALAVLPGWTGDTERIERQLVLSREDADALRAEVAAYANEVNHHPVVTQDDGALTFTVWTHSAGGVTRYDIALAKAISERAAQYAAPPEA